jgi:hypothetical protein
VADRVVWREEVIADFDRIDDRRRGAGELHEWVMSSVPVGLTLELSRGAARAKLWPW